MAMLMPVLEQARLVANSPSGWAIACRPAGDTPRGNLICRPKQVVLVVIPDTSTNTRDRSRYLLKAELFSVMVLWYVEPELKKSDRHKTKGGLRKN
jgi:hypothetical protein